MQSNTTQKKVSLWCSKVYLTAFLILVSLGTLFAQPYVNGNLSTGAVSSNGTNAPAGFTWSEVQPGNDVAGYSMGINATNLFALADDFTIPAGMTWNISDLNVYLYSTGHVPTTSPFNDMRVAIYNTDPSVGNPTPVYGNLTTNVYTSGTATSMYRIFTGVPGTTRRIFEVKANLPGLTLTGGQYWIVWQVFTSPGITSNFAPASTVAGTQTQAGNNAKQYESVSNTWSTIVDGVDDLAQDLPFVLNYTTSCTGPTPTISVSPNGGCGPVTLTASGAQDYTWTPSAGLSAATGATVVASPSVATTYTVTGVTAGGCAASTTVTVNASPTASVLSGVAPVISYLEENFDAGIPATWTITNNSQPAGTTTWGTPDGSVFPAYNGAIGAYAFANYNSVGAAGDVISNWLITPQFNTISNGDKLVFYTRTTDASDYPDRLEVRMSAAGASTNVGSTNMSVGDFTTLLVSVNPNLDPTPAYPDAWTRFEVTISGLANPVSGRFAFRYFVENAGPNGDNSDFIGLDAVQFYSPVECSDPGSSQNLSVNITGGTGPYTVVYTDGTNNITVNNYTSGSTITVNPSATVTYSLVSVTDAGSCPSTNLSGSFTPVIAPVITTIPTNATLCTGVASSIPVVVAGTNVTYQWQISTDGGATWTDLANGADYNNVTSASLSVMNPTAGMATNQYRVIYGSVACGSQTSAAITVTLGTASTFVTNPTDATTCSGSTAAFNVTLSTPTAVQWQVSIDGGATWSNIAGQTAVDLILTNVDLNANGYQYRAIMDGCGGVIESDPATLTVNESAVITSQPSAVTVCVGDDASFTVATSGPNVTYQWQLSTDGGSTWVDLAGETGVTLDVTNIDATMDGNLYQVVVTNPCTTGLNSIPASIVVATTATITAQPEDESACEGSDAIFTIATAGGSTIQWQESQDNGATWTNITGATGTTLTVSAVTINMSGYMYRAQVASCPAAIISDEVSLIVNELVTIATQPTDVNACSGSDATFTVTTAGGTGSYQWQISPDNGTTWVDIPGETNASLTLTAVSAPLNGTMFRVVINSVNNTCTVGLISGTATLSVGATASITSDPTDVTICAGNNATFTVVATGSTSYQWQVSTDGTNWNDITGATGDTYTITGATTADNGKSYRVVIGSCPTAITSAVALLTVTSSSSITTQPTLSPVCAGGNASLSVTASGATGYQWQVSTNGGTTFTDIAGATNSSYDLTAVDVTMNNNQYQVVVSGACGAVTSTPVTLTVNALPTVVANGPATACSGTSITLSGSGATTYTWDNGVNDNQAFTINNTTTYTVTGTSNGCSGTATITVTVTQTPVVTITASATEIPSGGSVTLTATSTPTAATYVWKKGGVIVAGATSNTLVVAAADAGVYTAEVENGGCTGVSNAITLTVLPANFAFITPNANDGNFAVRVRNTQAGHVVREVMVFDRKGARVYAKSFVSNRTGDIDVLDIQMSNVAAGSYFLTLYENGYVVKTALVYINK